MEKKQASSIASIYVLHTANYVTFCFDSRAPNNVLWSYRFLKRLKEIAPVPVPLPPKSNKENTFLSDKTLYYYDT